MHTKISSRGIFMISFHLKSAALMIMLGGIVVTIGMLIGGTDGLIFSLILAIALNGVMYFYSDKIVLSMYRAQPLDTSRHPEIYEDVQELSHGMGIKMPKLWMVDSAMPNAFATGRNDANGSVAFTSGIVGLLDRDELRGVIAHELSHIKNRDILVSTIAAIMVHMIRTLSYSARYGMRHSSQNSKGRGIIAAILIMVLSLVAFLVQLAISRSREYLADESGAHACKDPMALASALEKLHKGVNDGRDPRMEREAAICPLFIMQPFSGKDALSWLSTHPPLEKRIARLRAIYNNMF